MLYGQLLWFCNNKNNNIEKNKNNIKKDLFSAYLFNEQ